MPTYRLSLLVLALSCFSVPIPAQEAQKSRTWSVRGAGGEEATLQKPRITQGLRSLALTPDGGTEYLDFREERSTLFANGIATLVPWSAVERMTFEPEKKSVTVHVLAAGDSKLTLQGTTKYLGINRVALEYDQELPGLGLAHLKFRGGDPKTPAADFRIRGATPVPALPAGRKAWIIAQDKEKTRHDLVDPQPLYQVGATQKVQPELYFRIDVKVPFAKVRRLIAVPVDKKQPSLEFEVSVADAPAHKLMLVDSIKLADSPGAAKLLGIVARVPAGYKLFPPHTIAEFHVDDIAPKN